MGKILSCESYCSGHQTREDVIPTHRVLKYFKNKSQQVTVTNHRRNDMLEDKTSINGNEQKAGIVKSFYSVASKRDS